MNGPEHDLPRRTLLGGGLLLGMAAPFLGVSVLPATAAVAQPSVTGCDGWGAAPPTQPVTVLGRRPAKILVHHTATPNTTDLSQTHAYRLARSIQQAHFGRGWIDSGQQFTISRGGYVLEGRHSSLTALRNGNQHVVGAHCTGQNEVALGIENEGTYESVPPPTAVYQRLVALCAYACQQYALAPAEIYGHRDFDSTQCPGQLLYQRLPQLRADVAARLGRTTGRSWPTVRRAGTGERVRTIQHLLRQHGAGLSADGIFGSGTEAAVRDFQTRRTLTADGVVGPLTWENLLVTVRSGSSGEAVRAVQRQLVARSYPVTVDGAYGPATEDAVRSFQTAAAIPVDGAVRPTTWSRLVA